MNYALKQWRNVEIGHTVCGLPLDLTVVQIEPFTIGMRVTFNNGITLAVHEHDYILVAVAHRRGYERSMYHRPIRSKALAHAHP